MYKCVCVCVYVCVCVCVCKRNLGSNNSHGLKSHKTQQNKTIPIYLWSKTISDSVLKCFCQYGDYHSLIVL